MKILIVTPAGSGSRKGNRITAERWARLLRSLGSRVTIAQEYQDQPCDAIIALHARKSARSIARFHRAHPGKPLIVALTGTDLYQDLRQSAVARRSLELATRLILLQRLGLQELPKGVRQKARVIHQSAQASRPLPQPLRTVFEVSVIGHLRPVKDPFRTALAARRLPTCSRIRVVQMGAALSPGMAKRARAEMQQNPRYRWLGELPRWQARRRLARSRLLVLSSKMEGGANVVSEALAASVPIVSSRIAGSLGLLGHDYPGYFRVGDTRQLGNLLARVENDLAFYNGLKRWCAGLASLVDPAHERAGWQSLLAELHPLLSKI